MPDSSSQADLQEKEQQKQQSIDEMRDKKTGLERTVELKRDLQGKKQQEPRNLRAELQRLEGSSSRLQELENELAKAVSLHTHSGYDKFIRGREFQQVVGLQNISFHRRHA